MHKPSSFYIDVSRIDIAHEFVLNRSNKCEYPNGRKYYGIILCISGEAVYRFASGKKCTVCEGDVMWVSPDAAYCILPQKEFRHYTVNFSVYSESSCAGLPADDCILFHPGNCETYRHIFKKLIAYRQSGKSNSEMYAMSCLYELIALAEPEISGNNTDSESHSRLLPAKNYIEQNFRSSITSDMLAGCVNMSVTHFRREWSKLYGETAMQYRDRLRISLAKELLLSGYYTVAEVASRCGFDDINYFVRFFKKQTGIPPGKFARDFR